MLVMEEAEESQPCFLNQFESPESWLTMKVESQGHQVMFGALC